MAKLSQIQGIKLSQNIALTPQLIQAIKLFELNNIELEEYIDREIIDNPFLDRMMDPMKKTMIKIIMKIIYLKITHLVNQKFIYQIKRAP